MARTGASQMKGVEPKTEEKFCAIETGLNEQLEERGTAKVISTFLSTSSLHGLSHIARCRTTGQRAKWLVMLLSIATFYLVTTASILDKALSEVSYRISFMVKDSFNSDVENLPLFPGVTVCSYSPFRLKKLYTSDLSKYIFLSLGLPFTGLTFRERAELVSRSNQSSDDINISGFSLISLEREFEGLKRSRHSLNLKDIVKEQSIRCEELFIYCYLGDRTTDCCSIFKGHLSTNGMCFTFVPNNTEQIQLNGKSMYMELAVHEDNATEKEGVVFCLHDPKSTPKVKPMDEGIAVWPGMMANVKYTLQVVSDLVERVILNLETDYKERYKGNEMITRVGCPLKNMETTSPHVYTQINCENFAMLDAVRNLCNCSLVMDDRIQNNSREEYCDPKKMYECVLPMQQEIMEEVHKCKPGCKEFKYQFFVNYARISSYSRQTLSSNGNQRDSTVSITLRQKDQTFEFLKYQRYTYSSTLSEIGGLMGLFLGASLITVIEITIFLLQYFWQLAIKTYTMLIKKSKNTLNISHA